MKLYVDNTTTPKDGSWTHVTTFREFRDLLDHAPLEKIELIRFGPGLDPDDIDKYSLIGDLSEPGDPFDCALYMIEKFAEKKLNLPECIAPFLGYHKENIAAIIDSYNQTRGDKNRCISVMPKRELVTQY